MSYLKELEDIVQNYCGCLPKDKNCENWNELQQKMVKDINVVITKNFKHIIPYENLKTGTKVQDKNGKVVRVKDCRDIHNIIATDSDGNDSLYCVVKNCVDGTLNVPFYDPLYYLNHHNFMVDFAKYALPNNFTEIALNEIVKTYLKDE